MTTFDRADSLPAHSPVPHREGYWETATCERCRRQAIGQDALLRHLLGDEQYRSISRALCPGESPSMQPEEPR
jgi:hypothetical protein